MKTIRADAMAATEIEIKRSRFLARMYHAENVNEARTKINLVKSLYPDARHHCSAYIVKPEDLNPLMHSSDDGEPAGTAGMPMLEVLKHSGLENIVVIVTRYFGGVLLGTGGLVRAYSQATQAVIDVAEIVHLQQLVLFQASFTLQQAGKIVGALRNAGWNVVDEQWGQELIITVASSAGELKNLESFVSSQIGATTTFVEVGKKLVAVDSGPLRT